MTNIADLEIPLRTQYLQNAIEKGSVVSLLFYCVVIYSIFRVQIFEKLFLVPVISPVDHVIKSAGIFNAKRAGR